VTGFTAEVTIICQHVMTDFDCFVVFCKSTN
jgi:hypothetical protein